MKTLIALIFAVLAGSAEARSIHGGGGSAAQGKAVLNLGIGDITAQSFTNVWKSAGRLFYNSGATPAAVNSDGFPVQNFSGSISGLLGYARTGTEVLSQASGWRMGWDAGVSCFKVFFLKSGTTSNPVGSPTIANGSGGGNLTITGNCGVAGSIDIDWNDTDGINFTFDGGYSSYNSNTSGQFYLIRKTDAARYAANIYWSPEAEAQIAYLLPESLRPMGMNILTLGGEIGTNVSNWAYRKTPAQFNWWGEDYPTGARCGGVSSFCTISNSSGHLSSAAAADTTSSWVDGENLVGNLASDVAPMPVTGVGSNGGKCQIAVTSTAALTAGDPVQIAGIKGADECNTYDTTIASVDSVTQFTTNTAKGGGVYTAEGFVGYQNIAITGKTGGIKKLLVNIQGGPIGFGNPSTLVAGPVAVTYNATLDRAIIVNGGIANSIPMEVQVQLANRVRANYWYTIPILANDAFVTNAANFIYANLDTSLKAKFELSNEIWNFGQYSYFYSVAAGTKLGMTTNDPYAWESLRVRQIHGNLLPASNWSGSMSRMSRLFCFQGPFGGTSFLVNPLQGSYLSGYGGGTPYNTYPNRPVDFINSICQAPYLGGGWLFSSQSPDSFLLAEAADKDVSDQIIAYTNASNVAASNSLIDQLVRGDAGTRGQTFIWDAANSRYQTPLAHHLVSTYVIRITVAGGNACGNLNGNLLNAYQILSTPTSNTFTIGKLNNGAVSSAVTCGTSATGTMSMFSIGDAQGGSANSPYTVFGQMSTTTTKYNDLVANGFSPPPALGTPTAIQYEGAMEATAPSDAQCTTLGYATGGGSDCETWKTAFANWQASSYPRITFKYSYDQFIGAAAGVLTTGAVPNNFGPAQLVLQGGGVYGLNGNASYVAPANRPTYYGFCDYSKGSPC